MIPLFYWIKIPIRNQQRVEKYDSGSSAGILTPLTHRRMMQVGFELARFSDFRRLGASTSAACVSQDSDCHPRGAAIFSLRFQSRLHPVIVLQYPE